MIGTIYIRNKATNELVPIVALIGPSAFDVAVQEGFVGTRVEWLQSLIGDVSEATVVFSIPLTREDIQSGDTIPVLFGKLAKLQSDLKPVAFSGSYADLSGKPTNLGDFSNDKGYQTSAQVQAAITALINGSPAALDTLQELAAALGNDPNFATTIMTLLGQKANKKKDKTATLTVAGWVNDVANSGYYKYTISDADIVDNTHVRVLVDIASETIATDAEMIRTGYAVPGSATIYAKQTPAAVIGITYIITY